MEKYPPDDIKLDLTVDQLAAMGAVAAEASKLDMYLNFALDNLIRADVVSSSALRIIGKDDGINRKRGQILSIVEEIYHFDDSFVSETRALVKRIYKHTRKRNILFHSIAHSKDGETASFFSNSKDPKNLLELNLHHFTTKEIWQIAIDFQKLNKDLIALIQKIPAIAHDPRAASPRIPP